MNHERPIRAILFDLDGVLLHSTPAHRAAFEAVFHPFGITDFPYASYAGWRTNEVVQDVFRKRGIAVSDAQISAVAAEKSRRASTLLHASPPLDPDCGSVLAHLAAGYSLALASSGSSASVNSFLRWSGANTLFRSVLSGDDLSNAKPHPEAYVRSAGQLGVDPSECLVVEDSVAGIEAARAAGAAAVGITGTCSEDALLRAGAVVALLRLGSVPGWLAKNLTRYAEHAQAADPACWTALIPAAGRGSRLGFHLPKILFPVNGRPILDWLLDTFVPNCAKLVLVLSPEGATEVRKALDTRIPGRYDVVLQETPTGMGDAVRLGLAAVRTPHVAVVWGDQVALRRSSVETCLHLHQGILHPEATCPTVLRDSPYIHFERDSRGSITSLLQAREGDAMPSRGESDTGFFCFRAQALMERLEEMRMNGAGLGQRTREFNLLPVLLQFASRDTLITPRIMTLEETMGINTIADAAIVEDLMRRADARQY